MRQVEEALDVARASVSLNQAVGPDEEGELGGLLVDSEAPDSHDEAERSMREESVRRALDTLPERERRALELRFGFEGEEQTLEAIGDELGMTRERARQLIEQGLRRAGLALAA
jgi:RNA polymerase primary sigma factor